jgi:hypothetical protein
MLASGAFFYWRVEGWTFCRLSLFRRRHAHHRRLRGFTPSTTLGKIFTMVYIFIGTVIILGFVNAVATRSAEQRGGIRRLLSWRRKGAEDSEREEYESTYRVRFIRGGGPAAGEERSVRTCGFINIARLRTAETEKRW